MKLRIGTRRSALALAQTRAVARSLQELGAECELVELVTKGDADQKNPFAQVGSAGLFVRELERALLEGRADVAVHSYKDLPSDSPRELTIAAVPGREDPRDRLLMRPDAYDERAAVLPLRAGARIGTAAARRTALLRDLRPDLEPALLRGNVPTRVRKLVDGEYDAILLAAAGLDRLERAAARGEGEAPDRSGLIERELDPEVFVPAPSQGAVAIQVRAGDAGVRELVARLDDRVVHRAVAAERALLALVQAGCDIPFGAHATVRGDELELRAVLEVDGELRRAGGVGADADELARVVFAELWPERGAS